MNRKTWMKVMIGAVIAPSILAISCNNNERNENRNDEILPPDTSMQRMMPTDPDTSLQDSLDVSPVLP